ncbi:hypothetical protein A9264_14565 [Vibrio sp. UCD-FRSSP16_10]|uniref:hypothetical protein n=1 Tax=unclassified Vibrio TaxID=2614977 RepID=UPI0008019D1E|nr:MULTISPECIES: hypothetical protein [unclassified Vibrio]OBT13185.1 hypothetical protein A9260_14945 [Vibrio sp. UCD-FRSSP16_30]OBT19586.1 hypothetical protein A9264_14565 [Vibrio sp. UCD-FRSSP16_10]
MTVIRVFANDGSSGAHAASATDYVHSLYQAQTDEQREEAVLARQLLATAQERNDAEGIEEAHAMLKSTKTRRAVTLRIPVIAISCFGLFRSPDPAVFLSSYFYSK